jgi:ElaA protein
VFVVEQECPYPELDGRDLEPGTRHVWAASDEGPIGYLRILDEGDHDRIGRVLVARSHRGRGLSNRLVRTALDVIGDRPSRLAAQSPLAGWYAGFGYRQEGAEFMEDGIAHLPMSRGI